MRFLVRQNNQTTQASPSGAAPESLLDTLRAQGNALLVAGDAAIQRTLAGSDSEAFLKAGRQEGGE
jgi:hypothetical protein